MLVGNDDSVNEGRMEGAADGLREVEGLKDGSTDGTSVGNADGTLVGLKVDCSVGVAEGRIDGS